jgi:ferredoxin
MDGISLELMSPRLLERNSEETSDGQTLQTQRPALFAGYADLGKLRHDYPLVLAENDGASARMQPLAAVMNELIRKNVLPGPEGDKFRWQLLHMEARIRELVSDGSEKPLSRLWQQAENELLATKKGSERQALSAKLDLVRETMDVDGRIIECDADTPVRFLVHAWNMIHISKARAFRKRVDGLILKLSDILKADFVKSDKARSPEVLKSAMGDTFETDFDFSAMSRVLVEGTHSEMLNSERRQRVEAVLMVLQSQRFYAPGRASERWLDGIEPHQFIFDNCAAAMAAFRDRLPQMVDFIEAVSIAELEIGNKYRPELHDAFFARFNDCDLTEADLAMFPSYLVCLRDGESDAVETVRALEAIASGFPVKVLIQTDDILGDPSPEPPRTSFGGGSARLAAMALGVNNTYVFQAASSGLCRLQEQVLQGLLYDGPALFSVYSGATKTVAGVPPYLLAAAAMESRAFPSFTYNPSAGPDWASRFDMSENPQAEADWPVHELSFEDEGLQRITQAIPFTHADFAICDSRYDRHWVPTSHAKWSDAMVPAADYLVAEDMNGSENAPYIWTMDKDSRLRRTVLDDRMINAARRCLETWRGLQELGGINNSHARRQLTQAKEAWEEEKNSEMEALKTQQAELRPQSAPPVAVELAPEPVAAAVAEPEPVEPEAASPDDPYIETPRCTTCNECTQINKNMFMYDDNNQAYIADPDAGTYRQLVEAAESCQVSIIHPGKPRNPDEPNLDELIERAEPFQ